MAYFFGPSEESNESVNRNEILLSLNEEFRKNRKESGGIKKSLINVWTEWVAIVLMVNIVLLLFIYKLKTKSKIKDSHSNSTERQRKMNRKLNKLQKIVFDKYQRNKS